MMTTGRYSILSTKPRSPVRSPDKVKPSSPSPEKNSSHHYRSMYDVTNLVDCPSGKMSSSSSSSSSSRRGYSLNPITSTTHKSAYDSDTYEPPSRSTSRGQSRTCRRRNSMFTSTPMSPCETTSHDHNLPSTPCSLPSRPFDHDNTDMTHYNGYAPPPEFISDSSSSTDSTDNMSCLTPRPTGSSPMLRPNPPDFKPPTFEFENRSPSVDVDDHSDLTPPLPFESPRVIVTEPNNHSELDTLTFECDNTVTDTPPRSNVCWSMLERPQQALGSSRDAQEPSSPPFCSSSRRQSNSALFLPIPSDDKKRRNSLSIAETGLLNAVQVGSTIIKRQTIAFSQKDQVILSPLRRSSVGSVSRSVSTNSLADARARSELKRCIDQRRDRSLTMAEISFLDALVASPSVSVKVLENATSALKKCPLYNITEEDEDDCEDSEMDDLDTSFHAAMNGLQQFKKTNVILDYSSNLEDLLDQEGAGQSAAEPDSAFRTELWTHLEFASIDREPDANSLIDDDQNQDNTKEPATKDLNLPFNPSFGYYLCFLSFFDSTSQLKTVESSTTNVVSRSSSSNPNGEDELMGEAIQDIGFDERNFTILGTSVADLYSMPHVLSPPLMNALRRHMPYLVQEDNFWMKYSMVRDGASVRTLLSHARSSVRTVLAIETTEGEVFGAFTCSPWRANGNRYYGSGESFLWRMRRPRLSRCGSVEEQAMLEKDIEIFEWTSFNRNIQQANVNKLIVGGGEPEDIGNTNKEGVPTASSSDSTWGFGLALNGDLQHGSTSSCATFGNPRLSKLSNDGIFEIANVEIWTMSPVDTVEQAEQLELTRAFIVEHSSFVEA